MSEWQDISTAPRQLWSTNDCIDVTLIWLKSEREKLDDAIAKIEAVRPDTPSGSD